MMCLEASRGLSLLARIGSISPGSLLRWNLVTKANYVKKLNRRWKDEEIPIRAAATEQCLSEFHDKYDAPVPTDLARLLATSNGMEPQGFCSHGFRFRGLEELEIITVNMGENGDTATELVLFADHLPNDIRYGLPLRSGRDDCNSLCSELDAEQPPAAWKSPERFTISLVCTFRTSLSCLHRANRFNGRLAPRD